MTILQQRSSFLLIDASRQTNSPDSSPKTTSDRISELEVHSSVRITSGSHTTTVKILRIRNPHLVAGTVAIERSDERDKHLIKHQRHA